MDELPSSIVSLSENAKDLAILLGLVQPTSHQTFTNISFTLFPSPVPKQGFNLLYSIQPHINRLFFLASRDFKFVSTSLKRTVENDVFIRNLFEIYKEIQSCNTKSEFELGLLRADYMFDTTISDEKVLLRPLQVEVNTSAPLYSGLGSSLSKLHARVIKEAQQYEKYHSLPENHSRNGAARNLVAAWEAYGSKTAVILFLLIENKRYISDERALEYEIYKINENISIRRRLFNEVVNHNAVTEEGVLFANDEEVAVVFFRSVFNREHYPTQKHWDTRRSIEKSRAIKCPSLGLQLLDCKKMQQVFAQPGTVEKFINEPGVAEKIRSTFAGLYSLDLNPSGNANVQMALSDPDSFVLKPEGEGPGTHKHLTGKEMVSFLNEIGMDERRTVYTLMDKIRPQATENYIVANDNTVVQADVISELGIFGMFFAKGGHLIMNSATGHVSRSKTKEHEHGGVMVRPALMDSPLLF